MIRLPVFVCLIWIGVCTTATGQSDGSSLLYRMEGKEIAYPRLSKDSKKILYQSNQSGHWQLYIMDIASGTHIPVMADAYNNNFPDWSFDNNWIAFTSDRDGNEEIYLVRPDGGDLKRVTHHHGRDIHPYFSPDGRYLLFNSTRGNGSFDIFRYTLSTGELKQFSQTIENETCARYSPDMKSMVFLQNSDASDDVMISDSLNISAFNVTKTPLIRDGWPMFSYDGKWIYYSSMETGIYSIYRIKPDGTSKIKLTVPKAGEEDARVSLSREGESMIYNKRYGTTIELRMKQLSI